MPAPVLKVEAETPESAQGETDDNPSPPPRASRPKETAAATTAPAATLAQESPGAVSVQPALLERTVVSTGVSSGQFLVTRISRARFQRFHSNRVPCAPRGTLREKYRRSRTARACMPSMKKGPGECAETFLGGRRGEAAFEY